MYKRKSNRLKGYDYSQDGMYFVTICAQNREPWFGDVTKSIMSLNRFGKILTDCWLELPRHYPTLRLDEFVVMPNHAHGIMIVQNRNGTKKRGLSEFVRAWKSYSTARINRKITSGRKFQWQKSFHDRIIRNETDLMNAREYIWNNPSRWDEDKHNDSVLNRTITGGTVRDRSLQENSNEHVINS